MDMVGWFAQVLERSDVTIDQHQARRGCGCTEQGKRIDDDVGQAWLVCFGLLVASELSLLITLNYYK